MTTEKSPNVVMIDYAPLTPSKRIIRTIEPDSEQIRSKALGDRYIPQDVLRDQFGGEVLDPALWFQVYSQYPELAMLYRVADFLKDHAERVAGAMRSTWRDLGEGDRKPLQIPSQTVTDTNMDFLIDNPQSPTVFIGIDINKAMSAIDQALSDFTRLRVLNLSLIMGKLGYQFDINEEVCRGESLPKVNFVSAYAGMKALENVPKLFPLCAEFPDLVIVAAGGNWRDDWRPVRRKYQSIWPKNLLVVGAWHGADLRNNDVEGMDIYVEKYSMGTSSLATGVASVVTDTLIERMGLSLQEAAASVIKMAEPIGEGAGSEVYRVLDLDNAAATIKPRRASGGI